MTTHDEKEHSELALSSSDRWVNCPGSVMLLRNIDVPKAGPEAQKGTKVHKLCEVALKGYLDHKLKGDNPLEDFNKLAVEYSEEEIENALAYRDAVWKNILHESITGKAWGLEEKFVFDEKLEIFGTVDFWAIYLDSKAKRVAALCDYKNGYNYVDAKSGQLKSYACALRREIKAAGKDIDSVKVAIFQPRCLNQKPYREATLTSKALDSWEKRMQKAAELIYIKKKPKFAVGDWCKWCPAKAICKKYAASIETSTALKVISPREIILPAPETIPDDQLAKLVLHADKIEAYIKSIREYALNKVLSGTKLPGVKAVLSNTRRSWIEDEQQVASTLVSMGLKEDAIYQKPKLATISSIEKKLGKNKIDHLTKQTEAKAILVDTLDPRMPIDNGLDLLQEIESDG